jgi:pilus assembly protein Flp/PilA
MTNVKFAFNYYLAKAGFALTEEDGQGLIEYVLIAALVGVAAIVGMNVLGPQLDTSFTNVAGDVAIP